MPRSNTPEGRELARADFRRHYLANADKYAKATREWMKQRRKSIRAFIFGYKSFMGCQHCGFRDPRALDFHHLGDKTANVADFKIWSWKRLVVEIEKCIVLCANCHRIETCVTRAGSNAE